MDWNFSFASSLGLTSGCHCRADFLYACHPKGWRVSRAGRAWASERAGKQPGKRRSDVPRRWLRAGGAHILDVLLIRIPLDAKAAVVVGILHDHGHAWRLR
eukprot:scaffold27616_cov64-Phaeocystis_antarctica.AAC.7